MTASQSIKAETMLGKADYAKLSDLKQKSDDIDFLLELEDLPEDAAKNLKDKKAALRSEARQIIHEACNRSGNFMC